MGKTRIDWCDWTMNPVWGCTGSCPYCYARKRAKMSGLRVCGRDDFVPTWVESNFQKRIPKRVRRVFVNSMSDIADWKPEWLGRVDQRIRNHYPEKLFLMLTKRAEKLRWYNRPSNVLLGFSCTDQESYISNSFQVADGTLQFVSMEPLLGKIDMEEMTCGRTLQWIICGAETGNRKGKVKPLTAWVDDIYTVARENHIPIFFKKSLRPFWPARAYFPQEYPR
jgi:protein gp37